MTLIIGLALEVRNTFWSENSFCHVRNVLKGANFYHLESCFAFYVLFNNFSLLTAKTVGLSKPILI